MVEIKGPTEYINEQQEEMFKTWTNNYAAISKMWDDSYEHLYRPLAESTEQIFEKAVDLSKDAAPDKYKEFYDEWIKTYQETFGKFNPIPSLESGKDVLEKFQSSTEESNKLFRTWITRLEETTKKTREILQGDPSPEKYKECYDTWMKSYEKTFDEFLELPAMENTKKIFENYTGTPDTISGNLVQIGKLWKTSYARLYGPWIESILRLSGKMAELSQKEASPEAYREFYTMWMDTFKDIFGRYFQSKEPSMEVFENFVESTNIYLNMYKSWIVALEKMSEKANEMYKQSIDADTYKEFHNVWTKMYEKAFDSFIEDMPTFGPVKEMMKPVRNTTKMYADIFNRMSNMWIKPDVTSATQG